MIDRFPWLGLASRLPNRHVFGFRIRTGFPGDKQSSVNGDGSCAIEEGAPGPEMQIGRGIVALLAYVNAADSLFQLGDGNLRTVDTWLAGWTSQHDADAARDQGASYCIGQLGQIRARRSSRLDLQVRGSQRDRERQQDRQRCGHYIPLLGRARDLAKAE